jgi:BirA family biotin operon repressor/biotin-[acetyl-CoA-carboxylase] ligase
VVIAEQQKSGRGRLKRKWVSPAGGLWFSVILTPAIPMSSITHLPLAAALAVSDGITESTGVKTHLKWPNDVMVSGKKVAGILLDISAETDAVNYVVIGVGINANLDASDVAKRSGADQQITSLSDELGHEVSRLEIIQVILENLEGNLDVLMKAGGGEIINKWKERSDMMGRKVTISQEGRIIHEGTATDLDNDGSLVIITKSGKRIAITSGDVRVRY